MKDKDKKKDKEKEKSKLKKAPPISSKKPSKRLKKVEEDEDDVEAVELDIEDEELDEDDEDEDIEDDEEELEIGDDDEEGPGAKKGKTGKAAGPGKKGRPGKRQVIDVDDLEPDLEIIEDETELEEIVIPKARKKKHGAILDLEGEGMVVEDPAKPLTRLGLIRARHEAIRREIDQIREDLESDEEE